MELYSGPLSLFSGKVRIVLDEKRIPYELISVPFSRATSYEPKHPMVVRLNPKQQVPVLVDGDLAVYDSTLINEYLEDRYPEPPLLPREPQAKARCRQLEAAADEVLFPHVMTLIYEVFYEPVGRARDEERIAAARRAIAEHYAGLERTIGEGTYLCGDFTVADVGYFLTVTFASNLGAPLTDAEPRLKAWYDRVLARPSVQREVQGLMAAAGNRGS
jgi:glutathione S-transferase